MKDDRIIRAIDSIVPDEERQNRILHQIYDRAKLGKTRKVYLMNKTIKWVAPVAAFFIVAVAAAIVVPQLVGNNNGGVVTEEGKSYVDKSFESEKDVQFKGFVLTAYAAKNSGDVLTANYLSETTPTQLQPNVDVLLAAYSAVMSSVPGLPFTFNNSDTSLMTKVSVDKGELLKWDIQSGKITHCGQSMICDNGETLYWSALDDFNGATDEATITVIATNGKTEYGAQIISIIFENYVYKAKAGELKVV